MSCYVHADNDAAYCNMVLAFMEEKRNGYAIVLSNNDGCVISATREVKDFGVRIGDPYFKVRDLCLKHNIHVFSTNFNLIMDMSKRVKGILGSYFPAIQHYSVDEVFGDLTGVRCDPLLLCREMKERVEKEAKLPISLGIGPTKSLCKLATHIAKREPSAQGVISLMERGDQDEALAKISIDKIWGIGSKRAMKLRLMGIGTALDFRDYDNDYRVQKVFTKVGRQIQDELRGLVCFPITELIEKKKQVMSSRTFSKSIHDKKSLGESIATHVSEIAQELRLSGLVCRELSVFVMTDIHREGPQYQNSAHTTLLSPTNNTFRLIECGLHCLEDIWQSGFLYKKAGVLVSGLQDTSEHLLSLFEADESELDKKLMTIVDKINLKNGGQTIRSMACGSENFTWKFRQNFAVPSFTTDWRDLPKCK